MHRKLAVATVVFAVALGLGFAEPAHTLPHASAPPKPTGQTGYEMVEVFQPNGRIERKKIQKRTGLAQSGARATAAANTRSATRTTQVRRGGDPATSFDLVFVGDGYTSAELGTFADQVDTAVSALFAREPFRSHRNKFNIWRVDVTSPQSGVDNDPRGIYRNTALDMGFWCEDIARLLCVDENKALRYGALAPDADQVIALGNTTTYGGAGGTVATMSGGNGQSSNIMIHELGHSIGGLGDEYEDPYPGFPCPPTAEVDWPNLSVHNRSTQQQYHLKWYQNMGQSTPDGGIIDAYQGGGYCATGVYRPSNNSVMRSLDSTEFNLPSRDALIRAFYRER
ncbi:M64 family metallopeptidase [Streptomyces sp. HD]|uniref:M64 family metallopeptidase n=1 Tax=Streptomyces sp. HD TaxID=3020892 RepID=UPI00232F9869|nr:M64 family metallopeptidase [Streptomyces sp. HD]MDC0766778.1 M64 family metallopeptidase [Streptomyces sp. HD]